MVKRDGLSLRKRFRQGRREGGMSLVELLVATVVGVGMCLAMGVLLAQNLRQGSTTQNDFYANCIADNIFEHARALDFDSLKTLGSGPKNLLVNRTVAGQLGPAVREEPILLELQNLTYSALAKSGQFHGDSVTLDVQNGPDSQSVLVVISVSWKDSIHAGDSSGKSHTVIRSALVHRFGQRYWG